MFWLGTNVPSDFWRLGACSFGSIMRVLKNREARRRAREKGSRAMTENVSGTRNRIILKRHSDLGSESVWSLKLGWYSVFLHVEREDKTPIRPATKKFHITFYEEDKF